MTSMRSGNRWMLDIEEQQTSQLWQSSSSAPSSCTNSTITPISSVPACQRSSWCWCSLPVTSCCLSVYIQVFSTPLISSYPLLPRSPHACLCFHWAALLSPCNLRPCQSHRWGNVGPQAAAWCQHMCTQTLVPSLCVTFCWMPRHFVLPVTINSGIITRLNTSHLQARGFY